MNSGFSKTTSLLHKISSVKQIAAMSSQSFKYLAVEVPNQYVYHVKLNRPDKRNAFNNTLWHEIRRCFEELSDDENCRAVVLTGEGKLFTAGIDLHDFINNAGKIMEKEDVARKAKILYKLIEDYQKFMSSLELCKKPVLAAVHSACIGAGVGIITAADIRYCTKDAWFQVKEVDVGLAADVGILQRLPKVIGSDSLARELCYTARKMFADEALSCGLVSRVLQDRDEMINTALAVAADIAKKSPVAVQATKANLIYSRDHSVQEGLNHVKFLNQLNLQSEDITQAATAALTKDDNVVFSKL